MARPAGAPLDPWIRTHWRLGARVLATAPSSQVITATVAEWQTWTGMAFPDSGDYVIPNGLSNCTSTAKPTRASTSSPTCGSNTSSPQNLMGGRGLRGVSTRCSTSRHGRKPSIYMLDCRAEGHTLP